MEKFLQSISDFKVEEKFSSLKKKTEDIIKSHPELFCLSLLAISCLIFLFVGIGSYPLMDVDETRYAVMARDLVQSFDWNFLQLNMTPFLEKPPLYFWLVGLSIKAFGQFTPFAVRFPIAILASFIVFFTYYVGKRVISRKFGTISALVLLSSIFFLILSHVAIIDMVLTVFMTSAIYCALLTHFCNEKNKKFYWLYFYAFIGLGFLAKGILALAIPVTVVFIYNFISKTAKDMFKPINLLPGLILFMIVTTPWHLVMYKAYGFQFVKEYFLMHHFARFLNSESIGRDRPFLYFVPVFLLGFMPWTFVFISFLCDGFKKLSDKFKNAKGKVIEKFGSLFEVNNNEQKLVLFSSIYFVVIFLVFSTSSTKLPTYILPLFPAASLLTGYYWWIADEKQEHQKAIYNSTLILAVLFVLSALAASLSFYFLPFEIQDKLKNFKEITIFTLYILAIFLALRVNVKRALSVFSGYILTMAFVIILAVSQIFNFVYKTGENEIVDYSVTSITPDNLSRLVTFDFSVKPSVLIEYEDKVNFLTDADFQALDKLLQYKNGPTFVIVKNKNLDNNPDYAKALNMRLELLQAGEKYSLYVKDVKNQYKNFEESDSNANFYKDLLRRNFSN